ncbi:MAG: hydrogen peroxide-inducible genes activator [Oligoflexia bacterium]|nr:hydrogen peroxide-inducible genes activator [Oligoflexia bacterium]
MLTRINYSLTQLEYVLAVYRLGHFAKAAEECQVTQPTLSMQIQKLESNLGVIIFDRSKKPILLTDAGQKLIEQVQSILMEAKKIEQIVLANQTGRLEGSLSLGVIPTISPYVLPNLLPSVEKLFPGIRLEIQELQTHRIIEALHDDAIDVGLLATPLHQNRISEMPLYYEPFSVLCRKADSLAKLKRVKYTDLNLEQIWLLEEGHCLRHQILDVCSLRKESQKNRRFKFESGSLETLKSLVNSYGGFTLLPYLASETVGSQSVIVNFDRPIPAREIGLAYRREHYKKGLIDALAKAVLAATPEEIRRIKKKDLDVLPID